MERELVWTPRQWPGCEHLQVRSGRSGITADGVVIAVLDHGPLRVHYRLECGLDWQVRRVTVDVLGQPAASLVHTGDRWFDHGRERADLEGCTAVDLALTPFTNTLPIRRLGLGHGESAELDVVYILPGPAPAISAKRQRYTRTDDGYRYESGSFSAELTVDADGIVLNYPGLWALHQQ
ncbi:MAG: putative glycolipid-binding domain-containing protein [bacterium]